MMAGKKTKNRTDYTHQDARREGRKNELKRGLKLFLGLLFVFLLLFINGVNPVPDAQAIPLTFFLDWGNLPDGADDPTPPPDVYPYTETHINVAGSGVDMTLTIPEMGQDNGYRRDDPGADSNPNTYMLDPSVFRYWHTNSHANPVTILVDFSQPVVIDEIMIGGNRINSGVNGVIEFAAKDAPGGMGNVVLPNPSVYPNPSVSVNVASPAPIPGTAPLNIVDGSANYFAAYVSARQSYVTVGNDATYHWAVFDYEGAVVQSLVWEEYCTDVTDPQTARANIATYCPGNSAYLASFSFAPATDWGDLPDTAVGVGSGNYNTTNVDAGPSHIIDSATYLGSCIDSELDGQPHLYAGTDGINGDDGSGGGVVGICDSVGDDEDGISFVTPLVPGNPACVNVEASVGGVLNGWMDFNGDGDFTDTGEQIFSDEAMSAGLNGSECFNVPNPAPAIANDNAVYARFRYTAASGQGGGAPTGPAGNGEVEDYYVTLLDWGDLPDAGAGTGAGDYNTQNSDIGPSHIIDGATYLGSCVDTDFDGQPDTEAGTDVIGGDNGNASGVATGVCGPLGDEDGVVFTTGFPLGGTACVDVTASAAGMLNGWIDYNADGDFLDAGERIYTDQALVSGLNSPPCFNVPATSTAITVNQAIYARFRYTAVSGQGGGFPTGMAGTGEVEDYYHLLPSKDWGDLPAGFGTTNAGGGPSHLTDPGLFLGACVDSESDGAPDDEAGMDGTGGDDNTFGGAVEGICVSNDDEDGVTLTTPLIPGAEACVLADANVASGTAVLNGWVDFNGDGDFVGDADEQLRFGRVGGALVLPTTDAVVPNGASSQEYCFFVPSGAAFDGGETHMRFRLSSAGGLDFNGAAADGEVEDYYQQLACVGNYVWSDTGATSNTQDVGDAPLSGVEVRLVWAGDDDALDTTAADGAAQGDDRLYTMTTDGNGRYNFCGLIPDAANAYRLDIFTPPAVADTAVTPDVGGNDVLDSDGTQAGGAGNPVAGPPFTIPDPPNTLPVMENGNQDNPGGINNFPDNQDDLTFDFGFISQEADWGDLPDSFDTAITRAGPRHTVTAGNYLGSCVDVDGDGQPDNEAGVDAVGGDDNNVGIFTEGVCGTLGDDEDGVTLTTPLIPGAEACVFVNANVANAGNDPAILNGWIDFDGDGDFDGDADESLSFRHAGGASPYAIVPHGASGQEYCFVVPADATFDGGETHMRFRLSPGSAGALGFNGASPGGEVEDYYQPLACVGNHVWSDIGGTPNVQDAGDAVLSGVEVRLVWAGANNTLDTAATDGAAQGDDRLYTATTDGNGRYNFCGLIPDAANAYRLDIFTPPAAADTAVTPDVGGNDVLDSDGTQAGGAGNPVAGPPFTIPDPPNSLPVMENGNQDNPGGINNFPDGQDNLTFDFGFIQPNSDWGDLPDTGAGTGVGNYNTTGGDNGPSHIIDGTTYLGACVDVDGDGQSHAQAGFGGGGDDGNGGTPTGTCSPAGDDEDGVIFATPLIPGGVACVDVAASVGGVLNGWIDFNGDGDFDDVGERVFSDEAMNAGPNSAASINISEATCFNVPAMAPAVDNHAIFTRFRYTASAGQGGGAPTGLASTGEVEDYYQELLCLGDLVWNDADNSGAVNGGETGVNGVNLNLYYDFDGDGVFEPGADDGSAVDTVTTAQVGGVDGSYSFCGLTPGGYFVQIPSSEFQAGDILYLFGSSVGGPDPDVNTTDNDDNGVDGGNAAVNGIESAAVLNLSVGAEPTADGNTNDRGNSDANTNMALDFGVASSPMDYGDLPSNYASTELVDNGARHTGDGLRLGATWDADNDGQESGDATGDGGDEDGITIPSMGDPVWDGATADLGVIVSGDGCLNIWIDFGNGGAGNSLPDGDFDDSGEHVLVNQAVTNATTTVTVNIPAWAFDPSYIGNRNPFLRARLTPRDSGGGCGSAEAYAGGAASPTGLAVGGEVEDYEMSFTPTAFGLRDVSAQQAYGRLALYTAVILLGLTAWLLGRPIWQKVRISKFKIRHE
ncbi:MAG: hypothetical protein GY803_28735 [Chloroflexi bacterium]|nr:hypothetical protein [Chloroflexota bacterium]